MTDGRSALTAAMAVLLLTAGCVGFGPSDSNRNGTQLTAGDVTDTSVLIRAHTETLQAHSFTAHATTTTRDPNETFRVRTERTWRVDPTPPVRAWTTSQLTVTGDAPNRYERVPERRSAWRRGDTTTVRVRSAGETRIRDSDLLILLAITT